MFVKLKKLLNFSKCSWRELDAGQFGKIRVACDGTVWFNGFPKKCPYCGGKVDLPAPPQACA